MNSLYLNDLSTMSSTAEGSSELTTPPEVANDSDETPRRTPERPRSLRREYSPPRVVRRGGDSPDPSALD